MPKGHTGKLRPHHHTAYGLLALLLVIAFLPLLLISQSTSADSGSYQTYAVVAAPIPTTAPTIVAPINGQSFSSTNPVIVRGSCPANTLVEIYKNEVMAGATLCASGGYSLPVGLFIGNNSLIARAYNTNDAEGPESIPVTVNYSPIGVNVNGSNTLGQTNTPAGQLYLTSQVYYRGVQTGQPMNWSLILNGGQPPYAVSISWGDGKTDLISRGSPGQFSVSHIYNKPASYSGSYTVVIRASDQNGELSYLQLLAIVTGSSKASLIASIGGGKSGIPQLSMAWQLLAVGIVMVASFWIGEKREVRLIHRGRPV